jgi:hypothetical protein
MQTNYAPSSTSLTFKEVRTLALASLGGALSPAHYIAPVTVLGIVATLMATTTQSSSPDI